MLKGHCPKCGTIRFGWALQNLEHQKCPKCDARLEIINDDGTSDHNSLPLNESKWVDPAA